MKVLAMYWMFLQSKQVELVSENNTRRAICRKQEFERLRLNKSPTEISDFSVRTKKRSEDVIIDRLNKVDVLKDAGFTPNNNNFWGLSNICHWNVIAKDEIVSAKDKVFSIRGTRKIAFRDESCKKWEAMIADPPGNNWGELCEKELIERRKILQKFRCCINRYDRYITSTKSCATSTGKPKISKNQLQKIALHQVS